MTTAQREGVLIKKPYCRLNDEQISLIDDISRELLKDPGLLCYNAEAVKLFRKAGAAIEDTADAPRVRLNDAIIDQALASVPTKIVLGARNPDNRLILDAEEARVRFVSGSETNISLDVKWDGTTPVFERHDGSIERLCKAAHLADNLQNLDSFIRCVNIQDKEVDNDNKDVNKFLASLNNINKHVMAGLTKVDKLDDLLKMCQIIAGGESAFEENPLISFIACVVKSPLQIVDDTAEKLIAISRKKMPIVISSCPMGGATGPFDELGMVAQINAEILAGVTLTQLAQPGAPVLYGSVPVRTRLDNLNDMYAAPQFNHYNHDCIQMARHYKVPCYSTAGVGDTSEPGIQATAEKMMTLTDIPRSGAQYVHYAFGLLERTNVFCPVQAVMDDVHIGIIKETLVEPEFPETAKEEVLTMIREVMDSSHKTFMYHVPLPTKEDVYVRYPLESDQGGALRAASEKYDEIMNRERNQIPADILARVKDEIPGILPATIDS